MTGTHPAHKRWTLVPDTDASSPHLQWRISQASEIHRWHKCGLHLRLWRVYTCTEAWAADHQLQSEHTPARAPHIWQHDGCVCGEIRHVAGINSLLEAKRQIQHCDQNLWAEQAQGTADTSHSSHWICLFSAHQSLSKQDKQGKTAVWTIQDQSQDTTEAWTRLVSAPSDWRRRALSFSSLFDKGYRFPVNGFKELPTRFWQNSQSC